jgi:hypothetical protein
MAAPKQPINFTARDTELLSHAFQCLKEKPNVRRYQSEDPEAYLLPSSSILFLATNPTPPPTLLTPSFPQIDYDLMALNAGFKGAKSARDSFGRLYDKILGGGGASASEQGGRSKQNEQNKQSGETGEPTPKKKKGTPSKRKAGTCIRMPVMLLWRLSLTCC